MTDQPPIACSLTAGELPARAAAMRDAGAAALLDAERAGSRAVLRFRADAMTRARLAAIVAAEALCCPFLDLDLELVLTVHAPDGAEPVVADMVAAFGDVSPSCP
jgi:hypothetical protein